MTTDDPNDVTRGGHETGPPETGPDHDQESAPPEDHQGKPTTKGPGKHYAGSWTIFFLLVLLVGLTAVVLYGLWAWWPSEAPGAALPARHKRVHYFWIHRTTSRESLFFVMVAFAGALGAIVHVLRSLTIYIGTRDLRRSWIPFYAVRPLIGAVLATILYIVLRAGLFSPSSGSRQTSAYGFAAVGALTGLFSDNAIEKLKKIAEELFSKLPTEWAAKDSISSLPLAQTGPVKDVGQTSATLTGTVNPHGLETTYHFEYGQSIRYDEKTLPQSAGAGQADVPVPRTLDNLKPGVTYHYRLVAQSQAGTSNGEDQQFQTTPGP